MMKKTEARVDFDVNTEAHENVYPLTNYLFAVCEITTECEMLNKMFLCNIYLYAERVLIFSIQYLHIPDIVIKTEPHCSDIFKKSYLESKWEINMGPVVWNAFCSFLYGFLAYSL